MSHEIVLAPGALNDLRSLYDYVADAAGAEVADAYARRIRAA